MPSKVARATERARLAGLTARRAPDDPDLLAARRDYHAAALEAHVREVVSTAPPLTEDQVDRLAALLRGGAS